MSEPAVPEAVELTEIIPAALDGERLDRVVSLLTELSRTDATALIGTGVVLVNGRPGAAKAQRLHEGDEVAMTWVPLGPVAAMAPDPAVEIRTVYEDDDVIVLDKQPGLVVHPGAGNASGTLVQGLLARYPEIADVGDPERPGIVHRIDRETSGLLMVARTAGAYDALVGQLSARTVHRRYQALVWGRVGVAAGKIDAPIGRSTREPTKMTVSERGREAVTHYRVEAAFTDPVEVTQVTCRLETGRTHQIRVHMHAIGHAVVGDNRYHGRRQSLPVPRLCLHAAELGFDHPATGEPMSFATPLPEDFLGVLARLS